MEYVNKTPRINPLDDGLCALDHSPNKPELKKEFFAIKSQFAGYGDPSYFLRDNQIEELAARMAKIRIADSNYLRSNVCL